MNTARYPSPVRDTGRGGEGRPGAYIDTTSDPGSYALAMRFAPFGLPDPNADGWIMRIDRIPKPLHNAARSLPQSDERIPHDGNNTDERQQDHVA